MTKPTNLLLVLPFLQLLAAAGCDSGGLLLASRKPPPPTATATGSGGTGGELPELDGGGGAALLVDAGPDDAPEEGLDARMDVVEAGPEEDASPACIQASCSPGDCGQKPDGCGGFVECSAICGDGLWMTCSAGSCACWPLPKDPPYLQAYSSCKAALPSSGAFFCGSPSEDVPPGCFPSGVVVFGTPAWCCPV